jgi:hypothetical protein
MPTSANSNLRQEFGKFPYRSPIDANKGVRFPLDSCMITLGGKSHPDPFPSQIYTVLELSDRLLTITAIVVESLVGQES